MHTAKFALALFIQSFLAVAAHQAPPPSFYSYLELAKFDNDDGILPVIAAAPVDLYLDIFFSGFVGSSPGVDGIQTTRLVPNSSPNVIAYSTESVATLLQGTEAMKTVYEDSTVLFLDVHSFYYGCVFATPETLAGDPVSCTINATYVEPTDDTTASQSFGFEASSLRQQMVQAKPVQFRGWSSVEFTTGNELAATRLDKISYTIHISDQLAR